MSARQLGHLNNYLSFSLVDGPGNRFVLFLQGCNFNCVVCHNPYTISLCDGCEVCIPACPENALSVGSNIQLDVNLTTCTDCDICVDVCPSDSTPLSRYVTVEEMLDAMRPTAAFLSGVTVSGGEATQQPQFVFDLFSAIKADPELNRLTTFIDSNGAASQEVWELLAPVTDGVMLDLKALDPQTHLEMTGSPNTEVLSSIRYLSQIDKLYEVRLLVVPGANDSPDALAETAEWLHSVDPKVPLKIIGFRKHGTRPEADVFEEPTTSHMAGIGTRFEDTGFKDVLVI